MAELLEVVDESDVVVGTAERSIIHQQGLLHREVHVFVTDGTRIALQRRSQGARSWQGYLDATVGGHVEVGETYEQAAIHEMKEELGFAPDMTRFRDIAKARIPTRDAYNGYHNNVWRTIYCYTIASFEALTPETGKSDGFEWFTIDELCSDTSPKKTECIPVIVDTLYREYYARMRA